MATALSKRRALLDDDARLRIARAKQVVIGICAVGFAAAFVLTKTSHPSHAKHRLEQLQAPNAFVKQVQESQLQGGVIAPPQAPPEAQTATS